MRPLFSDQSPFVNPPKTPERIVFTACLQPVELDGLNMKAEEISGMPGSYEIELGEHDRVVPGKGENGQFYSVEIRHERPEIPGDAYMKVSSKLLFENDDVRVFGNFSTYKEFDGKLLGLHVYRK